MIYTTIKIDPRAAEQIKSLIKMYSGQRGYVALFGHDREIERVVDLTTPPSMPHQRNTYDPNKDVKLWNKRDYLGMLVIGETPANQLSHEEEEVIGGRGKVLKEKGRTSCCLKACCTGENVSISAYLSTGFREIQPPIEVLV